MNYCPQNQPIVFPILMINGLKKLIFNLKYIYYEYNHHNNYL